MPAIEQAVRAVPLGIIKSTPRIAVLACGNDKSKVDAPGPVYSPSIANALRALAADCKLEKTPTRQTRDCNGRLGIVKIELGEGDRFRGLTIGLRSMIPVRGPCPATPWRNGCRRRRAGDRARSDRPSQRRRSGRSRRRRPE